MNPLLQECMQPGMKLRDDLDSQHLTMIVGACLQAIRSIEGREPRNKELKKHFARVEEPGFWEFLWKKNVIIRAFAAEVTRDEKGRLVRHRRVDQVWKKRIGSV